MPRQRRVCFAWPMRRVCQFGLSGHRIVAMTMASSRGEAVLSRRRSSALFGLPTTMLPAASMVRSLPVSSDVSKIPSVQARRR